MQWNITTSSLKVYAVNLWTIFPASLIDIEYMLYLPFIAIVLYLYLLYALKKHTKERLKLTSFLLLILAASFTLWLNGRPSNSDVIAPLALLLVMLMPLFILTFKLYTRDHNASRVWAVAMVSGWAYSLGCWIWILALSRS